MSLFKQGLVAFWARRCVPCLKPPPSHSTSVCWGRCSLALNLNSLVPVEESRVGVRSTQPRGGSRRASLLFRSPVFCCFWASLSEKTFEFRIKSVASLHVLLSSSFFPALSLIPFTEGNFSSVHLSLLSRTGVFGTPFLLSGLPATPVTGLLRKGRRIRVLLESLPRGLSSSLPPATPSCVRSTAGAPPACPQIAPPSAPLPKRRRVASLAEWSLLPPSAARATSSPSSEDADFTSRPCVHRVYPGSKSSSRPFPRPSAVTLLPIQMPPGFQEAAQVLPQYDILFPVNCIPRFIHLKRKNGKQRSKAVGPHVKTVPCENLPCRGIWAVGCLESVGLLSA